MNNSGYYNLLNPFYLYREREYLKRRLMYRLAVCGLPITSNDRKLLSLKDKHKGQRCFIIGNGPSLRISDLDLLKKEISFASNKIYLAFDETNWRPSYYTMVDVLVAKNNHKVIQQLNIPKFFNFGLKAYFPKSKDIVWLREMLNPLKDGKIDCQFSTNALEGVYGGYSVIYAQMQLAFYIGIREVYLIGVDHKFDIPKPTGEICADGNLILDQPGGINHFHPEYRKPGEKWTTPQLESITMAFKKAKQTFELNGGFIYNASRKTELDVFPIVDFDEVI